MVMRYIEIAESRGVGLYEPLLVLAVLFLTLAMPRRRYDGSKLSMSAVRFLLIAYFPVYLFSLSLDSWGKAGQNLHHAAHLSMWLGYIRLGLIVSLDLALPRIQGSAFPRIVRDIIHGLIYLTGILWLLRWWGLDAVSLLTTGTVLGAIIGLSLQETLGNIFAGLAVQAQRPFEVGDWIQLEGHDLAGRVLEINWRTTRVLSEDDEQIDIPNAVIARTPIRNFNAPEPQSELELQFNAPYSVSPAQISEIALKAIRKSGLDAFDPECGVAGFGEEGVSYRLRFYTTDMYARRQQISTVMTHLWEGLSQRGISVGYPVREVWMNQGTIGVNAEEEARYHALSSLYFTTPLGLKTRKSLSRKLTEVHLPKGETMHIDEGSGAACYIIQSGELEILDGSLIHLPEGRDGHLSRGEFFGDMALLTGAPQPGTLLAKTDIHLWKLDRQALQGALSRSQPEVLEAIGKLLAARCAVAEDAEGESTKRPSPSGEAAQRENQILEGMRRLFRLK